MKSSIPQEIGFRFGALSPSLAEQFREQRLVIRKEDKDEFLHLDKCADALVRLSLSDLLPESAISKARQKLTHRLAKIAVPMDSPVTVSKKRGA